jgi:hypothetical protein
LEIPLNSQLRTRSSWILVREPNVRKQRRRRSGVQPVNAFDFANGFIAVLSPNFILGRAVVLAS